jgi:hypothetical protein
MSLQEESELDMGKKNIFNGADEYTPVSDFLCRKFGLHTSAVFGKIYRLSQKFGHCYASKSAIAYDLGINAHTVTKAIDEMLSVELIKDVTSERMEYHLTVVRKYGYHNEQIRLYEPNIFVLEKLKKDIKLTKRPKSPAKNKNKGK